MRRRPNYLDLVICFISASLLFSGCLGLASDITPPPDQPFAPLPTADSDADGQGDGLQQESSPAPTPVMEEGSVAVDVLDTTGGALIEKGLEVTLEGYDEFNLAYQDQLPVPSSGQVVFEDVPILDGRVFFSSVPYGGAVYRSEIFQADESTSSLNFLIRIYETTQEQTSLVTDRLHVLVDLPEPGLAQVTEIFVLSNLGSETVVGGSPGEASVEFSLPAGAEAIQFEDGELGGRFLLTEDGFGDTVGILPGSGVYQVLVTFVLPAQRNRLDFSQTMNYPLNAAVIMTPANAVSIKGESLEDLGTQSLPGEEVQVYSAGPISEGEPLVFRVSDKSTAAGWGLLRQGNLTQILIFAVGISGAVLLVSGLWLHIRNRRPISGPLGKPSPSYTREEILDSIIALEDLYQEGEISRELYDKKRERFKDQLRELVEGEDK